MSISFIESNKVVEDFYDRLKEVSVEVENARDLDPVIEKMGDAKVVLLGEASHGTHEFYTWRSAITQRLIREKNFNFIGVEGDWPDCYKINRFVKQYENSGKESFDVVNTFKRWPSWMWANWEIVALIEWLKKFNADLPDNKRAGFYGLDVYSLWDSLGAIIQYLKKNDPEGLEKAREVFRCFEPYSDGEGQAYARALRMVDENCREEVVNLLSEIRKKVPQYNSDPEAALNTGQNAAVAVNAEEYYRTMILSGPRSWNVRDSHMMETLERLLDYHGEDAKAVIWAHNTHIGDARYTNMRNEDMVNIGQLARQKYGREQCYLYGFGSSKGTVVAGESWGAPMKKMLLPEALKDSWEHLLSRMGRENQVLFVNELAGYEPLRDFVGHRAVGVVYDPEHESYGNYVPSVLPQRYDAFHFIDETMALHPIHIKPAGNKIPETYPWNV
ncbi:MAG: erythromycin esterase family protein [Balneolaceae bacterium]